MSEMEYTISIASEEILLSEDETMPPVGEGVGGW